MFISQRAQSQIELKKEGKGELHNPSKTPPNNFETHISGEERHGHRHQGNAPSDCKLRCVL